MTKQEHKDRHMQLHKSLDELAADYMNITGKLMSQTTVMDLCTWSYEQTKNPATVNDQKHSDEPGPVKPIREFKSPTTLVNKKLLTQLSENINIEKAKVLIITLKENKKTISKYPKRMIKVLEDNDFIRDYGPGQHKLTAGGCSLRATLINPEEHNDEESLKRFI